MKLKNKLNIIIGFLIGIIIFTNISNIGKSDVNYYFMSDDNIQTDTYKILVEKQSSDNNYICSTYPNAKIDTLPNSNSTMIFTYTNLVNPYSRYLYYDWLSVDLNNTINDAYYNNYAHMESVGNIAQTNPMIHSIVHFYDSGVHKYSKNYYVRFGIHCIGSPFGYEFYRLRMNITIFQENDHNILKEWMFEKIGYYNGWENDFLQYDIDVRIHHRLESNVLCKSLFEINYNDTIYNHTNTFNTYWQPDQISSFNYYILENNLHLNRIIHSCLSKSRNLYIPTSSGYHNRFYSELPFLIDYDIPIEVYEPDDTDPDDDPSEPTGKYWKYTTFMIEKDDTLVIEYSDYVVMYNSSNILCNVSMKFDTIKGKSQEAKFYYNDRALSRSALGSWSIEFVLNVKVSFNWLRNVIVYIINQVLLLIQFIWYIVIIAINYLFLFLIMMFIIPFFWNVIIYWILVVLLALLFVLCLLGLYIAGNILYWLDILFNWILNDVIPWLILIFITIMAFLFALLLWSLSFGTANFDQIYNQIYDFLYTISDFIVETLEIVFTHLPVILAFLFIYIILTFFCYIKLMYVKAKGYKERTERLSQSLGLYMLPLRFCWNIGVKIYGIIPIISGSAPEVDNPES